MNTPWREEMRCSRCSQDTVVEIHLTIAGEAIVFRRCGRCEDQAWESTEGLLPLTRVLELARTPR